MSAEDRFAGIGVAGYRHAERSYLSQDSSCSTSFELDVVSLGGMMIVNRFLFFFGYHHSALESFHVDF